MLEHMVRSAEVSEVVCARATAERMIVVVVDVAAVHGLTAAGEPAVLITGTQEPAHGLGGGVGVGLRDQPARIEEEPGPSGARTRQRPGDLRVERPVTVEFRGAVVGADESGGCDGHLYGGADVL